MQEVEASLHSMRIQFSSEEVAKLFRRLDHDQNGSVSFEEWTVRPHSMLVPLVRHCACVCVCVVCVSMC